MATDGMGRAGQRNTDSVVDQMARLKLKQLEKRLENERGMYYERGESRCSTRSYDEHTEALHNALRRKRDLLQRLKEQYALEDLARPHTWAGTRRQHHYRSHTPPAPPIHIYQPPAPQPPAPLPPRIIQQTLPQQPATIIQQLPQQQPLIAQIPPPQAAPYRSGSIKEDMVELMLMQNAQMHQIIMHNMMLKALPPMAFSQGSGSNPIACRTRSGQENYMKANRSAVHHHHYAPPPLPPIGYPFWPSTMTSEQRGAYQPTIHHVTAPVTLPPINTVTIDGLKARVPFGL